MANNPDTPAPPPAPTPPTGQPADVTDLKKRQRTQREERRRRPSRADPVTLTAEELLRPVGLPASLAAATITPTVVTGPFAAQELEGYVVAERAAERAIPLGNGSTSTTTVLWRKGDRVRQDVHDQFWAEHDAGQN